MSVDINLNKLGIDELSLMQQEASRFILGGQADVVILSPTGSGKTLAYLLPLIQKIEVSRDELQAVVIVPNRELALQSSSILSTLSTPVRSYACYGGRPAMDEHKQLKQIQPQIIFATPGRLNDHLSKGNIVTNSTQYVVIDEFDKC
ncbi:MAG: DEAD/DEAH box helicase, partial [Prevotella buccalis]|nr:DEAD/DEAH box helicase [Hoylesella buccalis]